MEYAVRGPLVIRASEIAKQLKQGAKKPFPDVINANIGDSHAMGQKPITFIRQVLALVAYTPLMDDPNIPSDAKERACEILKGCSGGSIGAYTDSAGNEVIRKQVARFIEERDGVPCRWENIFLFNGVSEAIKLVLKMINNPSEENKTGVLLPVPTFPLYTATLTELDAHLLTYYLDESRGWSIDLSAMEKAVKEARTKCNLKAVVIINPGNPTGQIMTRENLEEIIKLAYKERLLILADEVYQDNIYDKCSSFNSFKKVLTELGEPYNKMQLVSFYSCSKSFLGEAGARGGYLEFINIGPEVHSMVTKAISVRLCANTFGQCILYVMAKPPTIKEPSYELFIKEKRAILDSLAKRAEIVTDVFNNTEGITCNEIQGAMYAFPRLHLPQKAIERASTLKQAPDAFYVMQLLENTGICFVPGSGFGQVPGTHHFRTTILPQPEKLEIMLRRFQDYHVKFLQEYK